ncbi:MAG: pitrilysin family protein [Oxalobacteraceae bacterium]|nr:pitrilysin family protein [Oxalobacteraceae bacterium]
MKRILFTIVLATGFVLGAVPAHAALQIQSWALENGARVLFVENHTIPMLDVSVEFDAGARRDPAGLAGLAAFTNGMLARGVLAVADEPALSEAQVSDAFADTAARRGGVAGSDRAGVSLRTLSSPAERDAALALLARMLAQPSFPDDIIGRDKARAIASLKEDLTKPEAIADKAFSKALYGDHPYGPQASVDSVAAISRDNVLEFHRSHYVADQAVIAMIGDISRAEADAIARQLTQRLPQGAAALPALPPVPPAHAEELRIAHPASQAHILIGAPALQRSDPDYFTLTVGNYVLGGGGFVSRLTREVREKRGLSYSIYSYFSPMAQPGPFQIGLQTSKAQADDALKVVRSTLADFLRDGPSQAELKAAKDNLVGGFALRIDNNRKILDNIAAIGYYRLPLDYLDTWTAKVAQVTTADIRAAFARKVALDKLVTVVVGVEQKK